MSIPTSDILALERTVQFIKPDKNNDRPSVRFRIPEPDNSFFNAITILSDVRTSILLWISFLRSWYPFSFIFRMIFQSKAVEVFGDHDIYIDTLHGKMIEEEEGFYVY